MTPHDSPRFAIARRQTRSSSPELNTQTVPSSQMQASHEQDNPSLLMIRGMHWPSTHVASAAQRPSTQAEPAEGAGMHCPSPQYLSCAQSPEMRHTVPRAVHTWDASSPPEAPASAPLPALPPSPGAPPLPASPGAPLVLLSPVP